MLIDDGVPLLRVAGRLESRLNEVDNGECIKSGSDSGANAVLCCAVLHKDPIEIADSRYLRQRFQRPRVVMQKRNRKGLLGVIYMQDDIGTM